MREGVPLGPGPVPSLGPGPRERGRTGLVIEVPGLCVQPAWGTGGEVAESAWHGGDQGLGAAWEPGAGV